MTSLHADETFLTHYQLSHDPFAPRVPGFKFFPAQRKPVLGQLHHLARYSQLLLVVCGPQGSGKTLLRQALVASTNKQAVHSVVVSAREAAAAGGVVKQIAQGIGAASASASAVLTRAAQMALTGQEVYVLVDDAEQLDDAALQSLIALARGSGEGRLHLFLFAASSLIERLELIADGEECFHAIELQPYSESETRDYLAQRLEGAGQGVDLFSEEQIEDIHLQSGGWPGAINQVARETLIESMLADRGAARQRGAGMPKKHLLALLVVGAAVAAAWFMQGEQAEQPQPAVVEDHSLPAPAEVVPAAAEKPGGGPAIEFAGSSQPLPLPLVGEAQPVIREPLAQAAGQAEPEDAVEVDVSGVPVAEVAPPAQPMVPTPAPVAAPAPAPAPAPVTQPVPLPVPAAKPSAPVVAAPAAPVSPPPAPKPAAAAPVAKPVAKPAVAAVQAKAAVPASADWYRAQVGSRFAVQILGTRVESSAQAFVRQHGSEYRYFMKMHQGQPLYVVTYGVFSTRAAAQASIKSLPAQVQAGKPWPKSFASIQQEMAGSR